MQAGFAKTDITPRVGGEMCGFGAYLQRRSVGVRDRLWARAMALKSNGETLVLVSCDICLFFRPMTHRIRALVADEAGIPPQNIMVHATHTHSGPGMDLTGWGAADPVYMELLPQKVAAACLAALDNLAEAQLAAATVPCEGIGYNREYEERTAREDALQETWRPAKPELTDTECRVIALRSDKRLLGFAAYFGCHPVVCCEATRYLHGDYCGVAMTSLEQEFPDAVGLFLQGAEGDVNSCVVHSPEPESLEALDVVAARFARAVGVGLEGAVPVGGDVALAADLRDVIFRRKLVPLDDLRTMLTEKERIVHAMDASAEDRDVRLALVDVHALRGIIPRVEQGKNLEPETEIQGFRIGPLTMLAAPFEIFQAIKNDVVAQAGKETLVMGVTNDFLGYAPDRETAARGGYAAEVVQIILGELPFAGIHDQLVDELLRTEELLRSA